MPIKRTNPPRRRKVVPRYVCYERVQALARARQAISPTPAGLTIVSVPEAYCRFARAEVEAQYMRQWKLAEIPVGRPESLISLHSGGVNAQDELNMLAVLEDVVAAKIERTFRFHGTRRNFNFVIDEGLDSLLPIIESAKNSCVTFAQSSNSVSRDQLIAAVHEIRSVAQASLAYAVMFVTWTDREKLPNIGDFCDEYFEVDACEPNPGGYKSFSISSMRLRDLHIFGYGKLMCDLVWHKDHYTRFFEPFIAESLLDRYIWRLRAAGKSLSDIACLISKYKSTVKRRLDQMRPVYPMAFSQAQEEQYFNELFFDDPLKVGDDDLIDLD